ncbi:MAG: hypothetical protein JO356_11785 [Acidobacteria bacterium]|nr:hypothetical protein [Acidobacteriota bacterium]
MNGLGIIITLLDALLLTYWSLGRKTRRFPLYGWLGLLLLGGGECLLFLRVWPVTVYFTPLAWSAYLLVIDAMVKAITGQSRLADRPQEFVETGLLSVALWLVFEGYNVRLANWTYVGVPTSPAGALLGYSWSFSTITPAILETADLVDGFGFFQWSRPIVFSPKVRCAMVVFGLLCLAVPLLVERSVASYLFVLVWLGFVFLLDPINHRLGRPSLLGDVATGRRGRLYSLLLSGWICGWLWEFWNYWAAAKWHYIFPIFETHKIFEMPILGYLGFLPFALECFIMYTTAHFLMQGIFGRRGSPASRK